MPKRGAAHAPAASDGWRAVRRTERSADDAAGSISVPLIPRDLATIDGSRNMVRVLAQSPDEDFEPWVPVEPTGPTWTYPARRATTSVPVPRFEGELDTYRLRRQPESLALNSYQRSSGGTRSRVNASASYPARPAPVQQPATEYESPPPLPSFHATPSRQARPSYSNDGVPLQRTTPSFESDANPCAPCQQAPFDDPCAQAYEGYRYTWDSIYLFGLFDAFRLDHENTRAGGRLGLNWGLPVIDDDSGLGFQIGVAGSVLEEGPQWFATSGLFYRGDMQSNSAWNIGAVFDWMHDDEIGAGIGQVRGMSSITLDRKNEIGMWGALSVMDDDDKRGHTAESVNQLNLFYRYLFDSGWEVSPWVGWRSDPESAALGASWYAPINDYWAGLFGGYYAFEGDTWNVYSGFVRHWGNRARQDYLGQDRHLPYLPVADNSTMTLFHKR